MQKIKMMIQHFIKIFLSRDFFCFLIIGVLNTLNGTIFSSFFSIFFNANIAFVIGYILSLAVAYLLNSIFTFKKKLAWKKYLKFCVSYIPNFAIQNIVVFVIYNMMAWNKLLAYFFAAILGIPITFLFIRFFAFKNRKMERRILD